MATLLDIETFLREQRMTAHEFSVLVFNASSQVSEYRSGSRPITIAMSQRMDSFFKAIRAGEPWTWTPTKAPRRSEQSKLDALLNPAYENNTQERANADMVAQGSANLLAAIWREHHGIMRHMGVKP